MKVSRRGFLLAILCSCLAVSVKGDCVSSSANGCLPGTDLQKLPAAGDPSVYCPSAVSLAYEVSVCLNECNFTSTDVMDTFSKGFENVCSVAPGCKDIGVSFKDLQSCFDSWGGLSALLRRIVASFNSRLNVDALCRNLALGKICMRSVVASCSYLADLMNATFDLYDQFAIAQHICGSEDVLKTSDSSNCANSKNMIASINRACDVSCSISATGDTNTICSFLQSQVDCFLKLSDGCTQIERQFVLPRLNTYSIANVLLSCPAPIQLRGVNIQPTGLNPEYSDNLRCNYNDRINDCFDFELPDSVRPDFLVKLLNGNFDVDPFCALKVSDKLFKDRLNKCVNSFLSCSLPVAGIYDRASTYDTLFNVALAPFPLDAWGLNALLSTLQCPSPVSPTLCKLSRSTVIASNLPTLRPTAAITRRTTPLKRNITPKKGSQDNNSVNEPLKQQQQQQQQQQLLITSIAPTVRQTPQQRTTTKTNQP